MHAKLARVFVAMLFIYPLGFAQDSSTGRDNSANRQKETASRTTRSGDRVNTAPPVIKSSEPDSIKPASSPSVVVIPVAPANGIGSNINSTIESDRIRALPYPGPVESLLILEPYVVAAGQFQGFRLLRPDGQFPSGGFTLNNQNNDGIDYGPAITISNRDAAEQLDIITTTESGVLAGRGATAVQLKTIKGTNYFHGTLFGYHLNRRLGSLTPLERRSGLGRAPRFENTTFGGVLGGPIRKEKGFFFAALQIESQDSIKFIDSTASFLTPTARGLAQLARAFPGSRTVADLQGRGPLAGRPGAASLLRTFASSVRGIPVELGQFARLLPAALDDYETGARLDFRLARRDHLAGDYWLDNRSETNSAGRQVAGYAGDSSSRAQLASLRWTRSFSPATSNELSFGFNRAGASFVNASGPEDRLPAVGAGFGIMSYGDSPLLPASYVSTLFDVSNNFTSVVGRHHIRLGASIERRLTRFDQLRGERGSFAFLSLEDFILNRPVSLAVRAGNSRSSFTETLQQYYASDAWRARANLTLSVALGYNNNSQPLNGFGDSIRERESNAVTALFNTGLSLELRTIGKIRRDNDNFAPRVAFAYSPRLRVAGLNLGGNDQMVVRGGVGVYYDQTAYRPLAEVSASSPSVAFAVITQATAAKSLTFPRVPGPQKVRGLFDGDAGMFARTEMARDFQTPYSVNWHLGASRDFKSVVFEAFYAGARGMRIIRPLDGAVTGGESRGPLLVYETSGRSIYHSLQTRLDARLDGGFTGGIAYTWSKLIDDVASRQNPAGIFGSDRALSDLDRRHRLSAHFLWMLPFKGSARGLSGKLFGGWQVSGILPILSGAAYTPLQFIPASSREAALAAALFSDQPGAARPFASNSGAPVGSVAFSNAANSFFHFFTNPDGSPFISPTGFIIADTVGFRAGSVSEARFVYNDYAVEQAALANGLARDGFGPTFAAGRWQGDVGRNILRGPRHAGLDIALIKTSRLSETVSLQLRAEFFNALNHPSRALPNPIVENAGGRGFADQGETNAAPRLVRLGVKLVF